MREIRGRENQRLRLSEVLIPFSITFAVGLVILVLYTRSNDAKLAKAPVSATKEERALVASVVTTASEDTPAQSMQTGGGLTDASSDFQVDTAGSAGGFNSTEPRLDPAISQENAVVNQQAVESRGSDPNTAAPAAASNTIFPAPALYGSNASLSNAGIQNARSPGTPDVAPAIEPDPNATPFVYPPRRIPWHQGFTVEEQWYRAWYGWSYSPPP